MIALILFIAFVLLIITAIRQQEQYAIGYTPSTRTQEYDYNKLPSSNPNATLFQEAGGFNFTTPNWPFGK